MKFKNDANIQDLKGLAIYIQNQSSQDMLFIAFIMQYRYIMYLQEIKNNTFKSSHKTVVNQNSTLHLFFLNFI